MFPFWAIGQTAQLAKAEISRTKDNLILLKGIGADARAALSVGVKDTPSAHDDTFEVVMGRLHDTGISTSDLYAIFLRKKRVALGAAATFGLMGLYGIIGGVLAGDVRSIVLGILSLASGHPIFYMLALSAQLRLWQLQTRRLSRAEKGGLQDFVRETKGWWRMPLDPEFGNGEWRQL